MTLPAKNEKAYLQIASRGEGFIIAAEEQHAAELESLFIQHNIPCRKEKSGRPGEASLVFESGADRAQAQEVLRAYQEAKGS